MEPDDRERARALVLSCPTRTLYRGDDAIVVRLDDIAPADRPLVHGLATEVGATRQSANQSALDVRPGDPFPLVGDIEYSFPIAALE